MTINRRREVEVEEGAAEGRGESAAGVHSAVSPRRAPPDRAALGFARLSDLIITQCVPMSSGISSLNPVDEAGAVLVQERTRSRSRAPADGHRETPAPGRGDMPPQGVVLALACRITFLCGFFRSSCIASSARRPPASSSTTVRASRLHPLLDRACRLIHRRRHGRPGAAIPAVH